MAFRLPDNRVLVFVLGLVTAAALAVGGWSVHSAISPPQVPAPAEQTFSFLCGQCGALFDLPRSALSDETFQAMNSPRGAAVDCPKCSAKNSAYMPTRCPACGENYISDFARGLPPSPEKPPRCPHCGVNPMQWHLQHVKPEV